MNYFSCFTVIYFNKIHYLLHFVNYIIRHFLWIIWNWVSPYTAYPRKSTYSYNKKIVEWIKKNIYTCLSLVMKFEGVTWSNSYMLKVTQQKIEFILYYDNLRNFPIHLLHFAKVHREKKNWKQFAQDMKITI